MKLACQINSYKGDGSKLETEYKFCYLELNFTDKTRNSITFINYDGSYQPSINFTLNEFTIQDVCMTLKGTNNEGYGRLDLCLGDYASAIYDLACIEQENKRLNKIFTETRGYFMKEYAPDLQPEDITKTLIKNLARDRFDTDRDTYRKDNK
jgi:hypothetical protein